MAIPGIVWGLQRASRPQMTVWLIIKYSRGYSTTYYPWVLHDLSGFKRRVLFHCHFHGTITFFKFIWNRRPLSRDPFSSTCEVTCLATCACLSTRIKLSVFTLHLKIILKPLRKYSKYLTSYTSSHNEESSSTTGRSLKTCLSLINIDVNVYQAHSTRSASTTKVVQLPPIGDETR